MFPRCCDAGDRAAGNPDAHPDQANKWRSTVTQAPHSHRKIVAQATAERFRAKHQLRTEGISRLSRDYTRRDGADKLQNEGKPSQGADGIEPHDVRRKAAHRALACAKKQNGWRKLRARKSPVGAITTKGWGEKQVIAPTVVRGSDLEDTLHVRRRHVAVWAPLALPPSFVTGSRRRFRIASSARCHDGEARSDVAGRGRKCAGRKRGPAKRNLQSYGNLVGRRLPRPLGPHPCSVIEFGFAQPNLSRQGARNRDGPRVTLSHSPAPRRSTAAGYMRCARRQGRPDEL